MSVSAQKFIDFLFQM